MVPAPPFAIFESLFSLGLLPMEGSPSPFRELRLCSQTARVALCCLCFTDKILKAISYFPHLKKTTRVLASGTSLVVQWLGISTLSLPGTWIQSLVRELRLFKMYSVAKKTQRACIIVSEGHGEHSLRQGMIPSTQKCSENVSNIISLCWANFAISKCHRKHQDR